MLGKGWVHPTAASKLQSTPRTPMRDLVSIAALVCFGLVDDPDPGPGLVDDPGPGLVDDPGSGLVDDLDLMAVIAVQACSVERAGFVALAWVGARGGWSAQGGFHSVAADRVCCLDLEGERAAWLAGGSRFLEDGIPGDGY